MIRIHIDVGDAANFIDDVNVIAQGISAICLPAELIIVKIDNWFDHKWLKFSGKKLGAFGTWNEELTIPPFTPNRVLWERCFSLPSNAERKDREALHVSIPASKSTRRTISSIVPNSAIVWFSGRSAINERGAIMSYIPAMDDHWCWYASWSTEVSWSTASLNGISAAELSAFSRSAVS